MRMNWMLSVAVVALSVTAAVGAQSAKPEAMPSSGGMMDMTYTGCVMAVNHGGQFLLTRVDSMAAGSMHDDMAMHHDHDMAMKSDDMAMKGDDMAMKGNKDTMVSKSYFLAGAANFRKHVGHKVSVSGTLTDGAMGTMRPEATTLTVKTLKVIAKSCA